jgi:hypothetical protein
MTFGITAGVIAWQSLDYLSRFVDPSHMRVAGREKSVGNGNSKTSFQC